MGLRCSDFRGIAISSVISKVFEYCLLAKFSCYLQTDLRQVGFKKNSGCSNAIYTARQIVNYFIKGNCTASLCALDISKAFDKVNHHALFTKLMER
jgi:Reverse transcriptase (RNA-dependent DNA polymerase)